MEEALAHFLGRIVGDDETAKALYFSISGFRQRVEMIKAAVDDQFVYEDDYASTIDLLSKIYSAFKTRNRLVHSHYVIVVKNRDGELSYINVYFDDEFSLEREGLTPVYTGYLLPDGEIKRVNVSTFGNHGDRVTDLTDDLIDKLREAESGKITLRRLEPDPSDETDPERPQHNPS